MATFLFQRKIFVMLKSFKEIIILIHVVLSVNRISESCDASPIRTDHSYYSLHTALYIDL